MVYSLFAQQFPVHCEWQIKKKTIEAEQDQEWELEWVAENSHIQMHGAQWIGGGEREGDKGIGGGGIGKEEKTTSRTQHKNYSRDNRHQYQHHTNKQRAKGERRKRDNERTRQRDRANGMQIYWWAYDYQLEIFQSINFPNQWKSAYIWHTIPLLTVIFGFKQLSSEAAVADTHIRTYAQSASLPGSHSVSYHRANTPEKLWLWHELRHRSYGGPLAYHIRSLHFSLSLIFAIWMRIDLCTCSFTSVLCGLQMTFICIKCVCDVLALRYPFHAIVNDCECTIAWHGQPQRWWWWWYARTSLSFLQPPHINRSLNKKFHMILKYLLTNYHRT